MGGGSLPLRCYWLCKYAPTPSAGGFHDDSPPQPPNSNNSLQFATFASRACRRFSSCLAVAHWALRFAPFIRRCKSRPPFAGARNALKCIISIWHIPQICAKRGSGSADENICRPAGQPVCKMALINPCIYRFWCHILFHNTHNHLRLRT